MAEILENINIDEQPQQPQQPQVPQVPQEKRKYTQGKAPRKPYTVSLKKYHVEIKRIEQANYIVGDFCTHQEIADALNNLGFFKCNITRYMVDKLFLRIYTNNAISCVMIYKL